MQSSILSLDIWNTLLKSNPDFKKVQLALLADFMEQPNDYTWQAHLRDTGKRADNFVEFTGTEIGFGGRIDWLVSIAKLPRAYTAEEKARLYAAMEVLFLENLPYFLEKNLLDVLALLKERGKELFLLSNTGFIKGVTMRKALQLLGISPFIKTAIFSDEVGFAKPHPKIFENLLQQAQSEVQNILHIGDNFHADYQGAARMGMQAICFNPNNAYFANEIHQIDSLNSLLLL